MTRELSIKVTDHQKRILAEAMNTKIGETLKLQNATDDMGLRDLLDARLSELRATYRAVQDAEVTK